MCDHVWDNRLDRENEIIFYCFVTIYVERRCCRPNNMKPIQHFKFEQDTHLFFKFSLAPSCSNDYIFPLVCDNLFVQNMVTYKNSCTPQIPTVNSHLHLTEVLHKLTAGHSHWQNSCPNQADLQEKVSSLLCQGY